MEALSNSFDSEEVNNGFTPNTPSNIDKQGNVPTSAQYADQQQDIASVRPTNNKIVHNATSVISNYSGQIIDVLANGNTSKELHASTWIHVLDSGGQPQFADISRAFLRGNCLNVIVTKLNEALSDKPKFLYSVSGQVAYQPCLPHMTNLQLIEHFVRSIASAKHTVAKVDFKPLFCIIGTSYDHTLGKTTLLKEIEGAIA